MIVLSGALVLVALVLLVFGALDRNLPYVYASIGVSVLSLLLLVVGILQRRGELDGDEQEDATPVTDTSAERVPALVGAEQEQAAPEVGERTAELVRPAPAPVAEEPPAVRHGSRRVEPVAVPVDEVEVEDDPQDGGVVEGYDDGQDDDLVEEDDEQDDELLEEGSGVTVLVVSGRPRYHLEGCRVLRGKEPQPLDRDDARLHGFSACGVCKPDADETAGAPSAASDGQGSSFTEALFGGPLFADGTPDDGERTSAPDTSVQPVAAEVEPEQPEGSGDGPAPAEAPEPPVELGGDAPAGHPDAAAPDEAPEPPAELRGDDPAGASDQADGAAVAQAPEPQAELHGDDPADDPEVAREDAPVAEPAPDVAADPDELPVGVEPDLGPAPQHGVEVTQPVRVPALLEADRVPLEAEPAAVPSTEEPAVTGRKAPAKRATKAGATGRAKAAAGAPTEPAAGKAPAKKGAAKRAPAKRAPATRSAAAAETPAAPATSAAPKRPLVRAVRADALRLGAPSTGVTTTRVAARAASPAAAAPVVVVPDRDRFHRPECRFVRDVAGATTLPKTSATRQGYAPCGVCKP